MKTDYLVKLINSGYLNEGIFVKVLLFSWEYPPHMFGGLGQHVFDLSRFMVQQGAEIHIITPRVENCPDYQEENGVHIHRVAVHTWRGRTLNPGPSGLIVMPSGKRLLLIPALAVLTLFMLMTGW